MYIYIYIYEYGYRCIVVCMYMGMNMYIIMCFDAYVCLLKGIYLQEIIIMYKYLFKPFYCELFTGSISR
jgi:hypothetical protein